MNHEKDIHENGRFHGQDIKFSCSVHKKGRFHGHGQDFDLRCPRKWGFWRTACTLSMELLQVPGTRQQDLIESENSCLMLSTCCFFCRSGTRTKCNYLHIKQIQTKSVLHLLKIWQVENTELLSEDPMIHLDHYSHQNCPRCREFLFIVKMPGTP